MHLILSRLLVRIAIVLASLAWAGFVFTQTIGDPGRGERIAAAVLADDAARAEVVAPVSAAVMRTAGLPPELRPVVDAEVDRALRDPSGAQAFVDPFAGSWARLLGEDDPRPTDFDLAPLLSQFTATAGFDGIVAPDRLPVPEVPLPRTQLGWMDGVRSGISTAVVPLALVSASLFMLAFVIGDRARVLRRLGVWAIVAGLSWVVIPPFVVWLARRWAPGADAVVAVALDEAVSGLLVVAATLVVGGAFTLALSFAVRPVGEPVPASAASGRGRDRSPAARSTRAPAAKGTPAAAATTTMPRTRTTAPTVELPVVRPPPVRTTPEPDDDDPLWDYYTSGPAPR